MSETPHRHRSTLKLGELRERLRRVTSDGSVWVERASCRCGASRMEIVRYDKDGYTRTVMRGEWKEAK